MQEISVVSTGFTKSKVILRLDLISETANTAAVKVYRPQFACWLNLLSEGGSSVLQTGQAP